MAWTQQFSTRGPQGPQGPTGATGGVGATGPTGPAGQDGAGVSIAGQVATYANLPTNLTNTNADRGKGYLVDADGLLYVWSGAAFPANGQGVEFRGPTGATGATGPQGATGATGPQGAQGAVGNTGAAGATGVRGSQIFRGAGAPGTIAGAIAGDWYIDTADPNVPWYQLA
jgi:hypothetical protein